MSGHPISSVTYDAKLGGFVIHRDTPEERTRVMRKLKPLSERCGSLEVRRDEWNGNISIDNLDNPYGEGLYLTRDEVPELIDMLRLVYDDPLEYENEDG